MLQNFQKIVLNPEFSEKDFLTLDEIFQELLKVTPVTRIPEVTKKIHSILGENIIKNSVQGFAFNKPHGYPGDFEIIDKMYREEIHPDPLIGIWDKYYHHNAAAKAVRNRKKYFKSILGDFETEKMDVLNLASGPCREIFEFFEENYKMTNIKFDCIDMDTNAINFAKQLNKKNELYINFINKNIFRFDTTQRYDLIWSAGLFDYFSDSVFSKLLAKLSCWVKPSGKIIIGNFSDDNPTQGYMKIMVDWNLNLRSKSKLKKLAINAGFSKESITIEEEEAKVNLFLVIENKS